MTVAVLSALALVRHAIVEMRSYAAAAIVAIPLAAILCAYNAAGLPYALAIAGSAGLVTLLRLRGLPTLAWIRAWIAPTALGITVFVVFAASAIGTLATFFNVVKTGYTTGSGNPLPLGQLCARCRSASSAGSGSCATTASPFPRARSRS